jgi:hypothetical protein
MASSKGRKPLPALAFLLALSLLTGLVWWRVLHRSDTKASAMPVCSSSAPASPSANISVVPSPAAVTITVLNSTQKAGLAGAATTALAKLGFKTGKAANDDTDRAPVTGVAEIRYGPAGAAGAKLLSFYVPESTLVLDTRAGANIDLALGAKYTVLASTTSVKAAMVSAHISQLPLPSKTTVTKATGTAGSKVSASGSPTVAPSTPTSSGSSSSTPTCTPASKTASNSPSA